MHVTANISNGCIKDYCLFKISLKFGDLVDTVTLCNTYFYVI